MRYPAPTYDDYASDVWSFFRIFPSWTTLYRREIQEVIQDLDSDVWFNTAGDTRSLFFMKYRDANGPVAEDIRSGDITSIPSYAERRKEYMRFINL